MHTSNQSEQFYSDQSGTRSGDFYLYKPESLWFGIVYFPQKTEDCDDCDFSGWSRAEEQTIEEQSWLQREKEKGISYW